MELLFVAQRYEMSYILVHIRGSVALQPLFVKETLCKAVGAVLQVMIIEVPLFSNGHAFSGGFSLSGILFISAESLRAKESSGKSLTSKINTNL